MSVFIGTDTVCRGLYSSCGFYPSSNPLKWMWLPPFLKYKQRLRVPKRVEGGLTSIHWLQECYHSQGYTPRARKQQETLEFPVASYGTGLGSISEPGSSQGPGYQNWIRHSLWSLKMLPVHGPGPGASTTCRLPSHAFKAGVVWSRCQTVQQLSEMPSSAWWNWDLPLVTSSSVSWAHWSLRSCAWFPKLAVPRIHLKKPYRQSPALQSLLFRLLLLISRWFSCIESPI